MWSQKTVDQFRRDLPLPRLFAELIEAGRWVNPGDDVMRQKVSFIREPLTFLCSKDDMLFNSGPLMDKDASDNESFSEYRGSVVGERPLPWIDVERSIFIIVNKYPGDDVGIALDYRTGINAPRVVGGDWWTGRSLDYRQISPTFDEFVQLLGL